MNIAHPDSPRDTSRPPLLSFMLRVAGMMLRFRPGILLAGLCLTYVSASPFPIGPHSSVRFERTSIEEGLSQSTIFCILRDSRGFLWFGTEDGLNLWDGYTFTVFRNTPFDSLSLSSNTVLSLYEAPDGAVWVGTSSGGLNRLDRETGRFTRFPMESPQPATTGEYSVTAIVPDPDGSLWIGTIASGLCRFEPETGQFARFTHDDTDMLSTGSDRVFALVRDPSGPLWVGTSRGLYRFAPDSGTFTRCYYDSSGTSQPKGTGVHALYMDRGKTLWVGTASGLGRLDPGAGRISISNTGDKLSSANIRSILEDRHGCLWAGTWGKGLSRTDPVTGKTDWYRYSPSNNASLSSDIVVSLYEDSFGNILAGTVYGGLNMVRHTDARFSHTANEPDNPESLRSSQVWSILEDREGMLWAGTLFGGVSRMDRKRRQFTHYLHNPNAANGISDNTVMTLMEDSAGDIWIGTDGNGLDRYIRKTGKFRHYPSDPADSTSLSGGFVWTIFEDKNGYYWVGTSNGLNRLDPKTGRSIRYRHIPGDPHSLSSNHVTYLFETRAGTFWVGTTAGLNRMDRATGTFTRYMNDPADSTSLSYNRIWCIHEDREGRLWIGTWGGGLNRYIPETGSFIHYTERDGLVNNTVYAILEDASGNLWMSTNRGISCFDPRTESFGNYTAEDGLLNTEFNAKAALRTRDGEMFFGGTNGITHFFPETLSTGGLAPPVEITSVLVAHRPYFPGIGLPEGGTVRVGHDETNISFEFAALDFTSPRQNHYAYRLEGFDPEWVDAENRRFATYTRLEPGTYTFRVRGTSSDGAWNETGASVRLLVSPPFWETWWFRGISLAVLIGSVLSVHHMRIRALRRRREELELMVREKTEHIERSHSEIRRKEELYRSLVETSPDAILLTDPDSAIIAANSRAAELFGVTSASEIIRLRLESFLTPPSLPQPTGSSGDSTASSSPKHWETLVRSRSGSEIPVEINSAAVPGPAATPDSQIHIIRDIRARKRIEDERIEQERLRGIIELAGAACHELNQPLQAVFGYSDLILSGMENPEQSRSFVQNIRREANRMRSITVKLQNITVYRTKPYHGSERIIDLDRAFGVSPDDRDIS